MLFYKIMLMVCNLNNYFVYNKNLKEDIKRLIYGMCNRIPHQVTDYH